MTPEEYKQHLQENVDINQSKAEYAIESRDEQNFTFYHSIAGAYLWALHKYSEVDTGYPNILPATLDRLKEYGMKGESYDKILNKLMDAYSDYERER
jgi:hypothetical protein